MVGMDLENNFKCYFANTGKQTTSKFTSMVGNQLN